MLVLTRRANQSIVIGHDVVVTVLEVRGDQVRLGIRAPREVSVHREEVYAEIQRENRQAAAGADLDVGTLPAPPTPPRRPPDRA
jgi:carbon storage regulator